MRVSVCLVLLALADAEPSLKGSGYMHPAADSKAHQLKKDVKSARSKVLESAKALHEAVHLHAEGKDEEAPKPKAVEKEEKMPADAVKESKPVDVKPATASLKDAASLHTTLKSGSNLGSGAPAPALMSRAGPGPAPAPAPAPLTYEQQVAKMKSDMMHKLGGEKRAFDADYIIERPNKVKPGEKKEQKVGEFKDIGNDLGPYAPAAAPLKHDDIAFKTGSLAGDAAHKNRVTMTDDWGLEYGPEGPKGTHGTTPSTGSAFTPLQNR